MSLPRGGAVVRHSDDALVRGDVQPSVRGVDAKPMDMAEGHFLGGRLRACGAVTGTACAGGQNGRE
ncbi:hypothetical protein GCM10010381_27280 [Streptomyces xantholiticus]|nr:hypothetical protein GCM10010381_27280 [Streptomyces xantholiticus]